MGPQKEDLITVLQWLSFLVNCYKLGYLTLLSINNFIT